MSIAASECKLVAKDFWQRGFDRWVVSEQGILSHIRDYRPRCNTHHTITVFLSLFHPSTSRMIKPCMTIPISLNYLAWRARLEYHQALWKGSQKTLNYRRHLPTQTHSKLSLPLKSPQRSSSLGRQRHSLPKLCATHIIVRNGRPLSGRGLLCGRRLGETARDSIPERAVGVEVRAGRAPSPEDLSAIVSIADGEHSALRLILSLSF